MRGKWKRNTYFHILMRNEIDYKKKETKNGQNYRLSDRRILFRNKTRKEKCPSCNCAKNDEKCHCSLFWDKHEREKKNKRLSGFFRIISVSNSSWIYRHEHFCQWHIGSPSKAFITYSNTSNRVEWRCRRFGTRQNSPQYRCIYTQFDIWIFAKIHIEGDDALSLFQL